jgi:hypothetical protein
MGVAQRPNIYRSRAGSTTLRKSEVRRYATLINWILYVPVSPGLFGAIATPRKRLRCARPASLVRVDRQLSLARGRVAPTKRNFGRLGALPFGLLGITLDLMSATAGKVLVDGRTLARRMNRRLAGWGRLLKVRGGAWRVVHEDSVVATYSTSSELEAYARQLGALEAWEELTTDEPKGDER